MKNATFTPRKVHFEYPYSPGGVVELFREFYGPTVRTFAALGANGRAALSSALTRLWWEHNTGPEQLTQVDAEYLDVLIELA